MLSEDFLHCIWKLKLFKQVELKTTNGESVELLKVGIHNTDAGPDFSNAQIILGETRWVGNIELHVKSSGWLKHGHQENKAYDNVILHVVYDNDIPIKRASGEEIPTIELKDRISPKVLEKHSKFQVSKDWVPCANQLSSVSKITVNNMFDRLMIERLERKSQTIINQLNINQTNWEETFYQQLARNFGFKINAEPFELLAKSLPITVLAKHKNSLFQIEALLFGQSGLLNEYNEDAYFQQLQNEYVFLRKKFNLNPIEAHLWKFMRLRPKNFPTIRIAQFAKLIAQSTNLFSQIIEIENLVDLNQLLNVSASDYWTTHFRFGKDSKSAFKSLGQSSINVIIINTVIPFLFVYGKQLGEEKYCEKAMRFAEILPAESNSIIDNWSKLKIQAQSAYDSQALLQLKNEYCSNKRCLTCGIGNELLKNA